MSFPAGTQFGPYEIHEQLGRGGMAMVYRAYQPSLGRYVAIKILPTLFAEEEGFRERFHREAVAVAQLRHPNILTIFDYGEQDGVAYLVSELVDGGTLAGQLGLPIGVERVRQLLGPVAAALDYAHARGIVHRDVKPANILLTREGTPILADFGLARMMGSLPRLTRTGTLTGTPEYMSPESAAGEAAGPAGDQYALAVVAFEMLVGRVPFTAETPLAVLLAHLQAPVPPLPGLPGALYKGLSKSPGDRFASVAEFVAALNTDTSAERGTAVRTHSGHGESPGGQKGDPSGSPRREPRRSWVRPNRARTVALGAGVAALVALGLGALLLLHPGTVVAPTLVPSPAASASAAGELIVVDTLANPASGVFTHDQSGSSVVTFSTGSSATYAWDFAYMFSAIVAHVLGPYPANSDGAWLAASTSLAQPLPRDFALQVRGRVTRSPEASAIGLGFESGPERQYWFYVTPADEGFRLELASGQGAPVAGRSTWILPPVQPNLLRMEVRGDSLRLLVNGHEVAREAPPGLAARQGGSVSLRWAMTGPPSEGGSVEIRFAQFALYALP